MSEGNYSEIWEEYTACWSETDEKKRLEKLSQVIADNCVYTDPQVVAAGIENISEYMWQFQQNFVGAKFVTTDFKTHHDQSLTSWNMINEQG